MSEKIKCIVCKKPLVENDAIKCIHCDSFQNWRRHFNFGSTVLSLLVALISVSALAIPLLIETCEVPNSDIVVNFYGGRFGSEFSVPENQLTGALGLEFECDFFFSNVGTKPGIVKGIIVNTPDNPGFLPAFFSFPGEKYRLIIAPGEFKLISTETVFDPEGYTMEAQLLDLLKQSNASKTIILTAEIQRFNGSIRKIDIPNPLENPYHGSNPH